MNIFKDVNLICELVVGSHLYGTNTNDSDIDIKGIFIPNLEFYFSPFKKIEMINVSDDINYYSLHKFINLAINTSPNIIELFFVPEDKTLQTSHIWEILLKNRDLFISKKARFTFTGYAYSQLKRIRTHRKWLINPPTHKPTRSDFGLPDIKTVNDAQIGAFNYIISRYLDRISSLHELKDDLEEMSEYIDYLGIIQSLGSEIEPKVISNICEGFLTEELMLTVQKEKAYLNALKEFEQFKNWEKTRNPKRHELEAKFGFDTKHASHLFRLLTEGEELLTNGFITLPRPDAKFLLEIRNGYWTYDQLEEELNKFDLKFNYLYKESNLPNKSNIEKIEELIQEIQNDLFFKGRK